LGVLVGPRYDVEINNICPFGQFSILSLKSLPVS
jgi:hypothetical protein